MHVYELRSGMLVYHVAATDEVDAREQGQDAQRFPDLHFLPFTATQIEVDGYTIAATPNAPENGNAEATTQRRGGRPPKQQAG